LISIRLRKPFYFARRRVLKQRMTREADVTAEEQVSQAIDEAEAELGPLAVLVVVAGIVGSRPSFMQNYKNFWKTMTDS
jgi:NAD(P)-dependent dehydrogenase (short-subunit alcohol dehydrogenase family)